MRLRHVYFWSLPVGTGFWHKTGWWVKTNEEEAFSANDGRRFVFEIHYGCVIHNQLATSLALEDDAFCECCPEDLPLNTKVYYEKLFGEEL